MRKRKLNVRFTDKELQIIKELANASDLSKSEVVRIMFNFSNYLLQSKVLNSSVKRLYKDFNIKTS